MTTPINKLANLFFEMEAKSKASEEDTVANLLFMPFSILSFNEKLKLISKDGPTTKLSLVQKSKAFTVIMHKDRFPK